MSAEITSKWGEVQGEVTTCRDCPASIVWVLTRRGKRMPVDVESDESHFSTCPAADQRRQPRAGATSPGPARPGEGVGPTLTGTVRRLVLNEQGGVTLAHDLEEASIACAGNVIVVELDGDAKLEAGAQIKIRRR